MFWWINLTLEKQIMRIKEASFAGVSCKRRCAVDHHASRKSALTSWSPNSALASNSGSAQCGSCLDCLERDTSGLPKSTRRWSWPPSRRPCSGSQTRSLSTDNSQQSQSANRKRKYAYWNRSGPQNTFGQIVRVQERYDADGFGKLFVDLNEKVTMMIVTSKCRQETLAMSNIVLIVIAILISVLIAAWADRWNQNPALFWFAALFFLPLGFVQFVDISSFVIFVCPVISAGALVLLGRKEAAWKEILGFDLVPSRLLVKPPEACSITARRLIVLPILASRR